MTDSDPQIPPGARISRESPAARQTAAEALRAMHRVLRTMLAQQGAEAALGHASGAMMATGDFIAYDLGQPETARSTFNFYARRLDPTLPIKPADPPPLGETLESMVAHNAEDHTAELWEANRLLGGPASVALAGSIVRATLRFLVSTYAEEHASALVDGLRAELDTMVAARDAEVTAPRQ